MGTSRHSADPVNKAALRVTLLAARTQRDHAQLLLADSALATAAAGLALPPTVAAYVGVGDEPPTAALLTALVGRGVRLLLPVVGPAGTLDWALGAGPLVPGPFGLLEPAGPRLGPAAVREAGLVLVPALAVDRAGRRLGRGGGYYDRALATLPRTTRLLAVVFDDEVLDAVPVEPHDRDVDGALTPAGLLMFAER